MRTCGIAGGAYKGDNLPLLYCRLAHAALLINNGYYFTFTQFVSSNLLWIGINIRWLSKSDTVCLAH